MENPWYLVVAVCAVVGAALGVINFLRSYLADTERVRVVLWHGGSDDFPRIEIINHSVFPITITDVGRVMKDGQNDSAIFSVQGLEPALPKRIDARDAYSFRYGARETIYLALRDIEYIYVKTALGNIFTAGSRWRRWLRGLQFWRKD